MNNFKIIWSICCCYIFLSLQPQLQAQEIKVNKHLNTVFAESGLNMRSEPNLEAAVVTKVPYGAQVILMDNKSFGIDTITTIKTETLEYPIITHWLQAKYNGKLGYLVSAYLKIDTTKRSNNALGRDRTTINNDYIMLRPGFDCGARFVDKSRYNWYGLYVTDSTTSFRPVDFEYINTIDVMANYGIVALKDKDLLYIIGSRKRMKSLSYKNNEGLGKIKYPELEHHTFPQCDGQVKFSKHFYHQVIQNFDERKGCKKSDRLFLELNSQTQEILPIIQRYFLNKRVEFIGDIDGDNKNDYIIQHIQGKSYYHKLFLSSLKDSKSPLAKFVAFYGGGPCC